VLLLDPGDRVLLLRFLSGETGYSWWATPGGGLADGESHEEAARREVFEETGLDVLDLGRPVWVREHVFPWKGLRYLQQERFFLARVEPFDPHEGNFTDDEVEMLQEHRWWTASQIQASSDRFAPRRLGSLLRTLLLEGPPPEPVDVGV
jgi:ADP-ribose pyrophosphatase YjhB (NUDIX family)